jgi:hypothetical protein
LESLQKVVQKLSNQVIDLRRSAEEASSIKGTYKPRRKPFPSNRPNPNPEGLNFESLQYAIQTILEAQCNLVPPENSEDVVEEETVEEEESSPNIFEHFYDSIFQDNFEIVHPYNTRSKTRNKHSSEIGTNVPQKQFKQTHYCIWVKFRRRIRRNCHFLLSEDRQTSDPLKRRFT